MSRAGLVCRARAWLGAGLLLLLLPAQALVLSGRFDDPANAALVGPDGGAPSFVDDNAIANNVARHAYSLGADATVTFTSTGFAAGGADPYFTLWVGGDDGATVLASNFTQAFSTGGDFVIALALSAGDYIVTLGTFANLSLAENTGSGSLADGFTALGGPSFLGDGSYRLSIDTDRQPPLPEPASLALLVAAVLAAGAVRGVCRRLQDRAGATRRG